MDNKRLHKFLGKRTRQNAVPPSKDPDCGRKVAFVPEGYNSWRVVWADEISKK